MSQWIHEALSFTFSFVCRLQSDVAGLVAYAQDRGIRIVPEFDVRISLVATLFTVHHRSNPNLTPDLLQVPGHSRGFIPIQGTAVQFCEPTAATRAQLYGDPQV